MATKQKAKQNQQLAGSAQIGQSGISLKKYYYLFGLLAFFLFANTLGNGYNMDDGMVTRNHILTAKGLSAIGEIFTSPYYSDAMGYAYGYRPMVHLSFALEHDLFGEKPGAGHFINVLLFALSVVLFFKLLVKWVGEKNALFAGIATLLFAVHPIHTEVVASLKNRDEILAFLFSIWAGLAASNYLLKGKWFSIVSVLLLFSIAMLSKKSVYPMAIILPAAYILLHQLSIKQLIAISIPFIIPAAVIGSELQVSRLFIMGSIPFVLLALVYVIKLFISKQSNTTDLKNQWILPVLLMTIVIAISVFFNSVLLLFLLLPLLVWLAKTSVNHLFISLVISTLFFGIYFSNHSFFLFAVIVSIGYTCYNWKNQQKLIIWSILSILSSATFIVLEFDVLKILIVGGITLFFVLTYYRSWLSIVGAIITIAVYYFLKEPVINLHTILCLLFSLIWIFYKQTGSKQVLPYTPVIGFLVCLSLVSYSVYNYQKEQVITSTVQQDKQQPGSEKTTSETSFLKEGRQLLYAENTLVVPHKQSEKIGTGFLTLGEYLRLHTYPQELSFYYGYAKIKTVDLKHPMVLISIVAHLFLIFLAIWQIRKRPLITIGIMWYLMSIVLFSNWVELVAGMVGERLAFTGSAGFCILIAGIVYWIKPNFDIRKPGIIGAVLGIVIVLLTARTFVRNTNWKDTLTLMSHDIKHLENSAQANNLYAMTLMSNSMTEKQLTPAQKLEMQQTAISHYDKATQLWPDFFNAYIDKGRATIITKEYDRGIESLKKAIEIDPENALPYYILLDITEQKGDYQAYLDNTKQLFKIQQTDYVYGVMARGYFLLKDYAKSKEILLEGLSKYPDSGILANNLNIINQQVK